jgi:Domain of unknown function (DUF4352)
MPRVLASLVALCLLLVGSLSVSAQDATPAAGGSVTITGPEGAGSATVTISDFVDPFVDYDPGYRPMYGYHFAMASISVENTGQLPFTIYPTDFQLVDTDGFTFYATQIVRIDQGSVSDFAGSNGMSAGDQISGAIFFQVLNEATVQSLVYSSIDRLTTIATFSEQEAPAIGEPLTIIDYDGSDWAEVTITGIIDPFESFDPSYAPERGQHYVLINITITNVGPRPLSIDPNTFYVVDADGFAYYPANLYFPAESPLQLLQYATGLETGQSVEGVLGYQVFNDVEVTEVIFRPLGDRLITVADATTAASPAATPEA